MVRTKAGSKMRTMMQSKVSRNNEVPQRDVDRMSSDGNRVASGHNKTQMLGSSPAGNSGCHDDKRGRKPFLNKERTKKLISPTSGPDGFLVKLACPGKKVDRTVRVVVWNKVREKMIKDGHIPKSASSNITNKFLVSKWSQLSTNLKS